MNEIDITLAMNDEDLWRHTMRALENGDFTWLGELLSVQDVSIIDLLAANGEPIEYMNEALTWACFEGRLEDAVTLLDKGIDPAAGMRTGMSAFHWAANRGQLEIVKLLIDRNAPLEQLNMYGGTVLSCALFSIVHENKDSHAEIIKKLVKAGAKIEPGTAEWWDAQVLSSTTTKKAIADILNGVVPS